MLSRASIPAARVGQVARHLSTSAARRAEDVYILGAARTATAKFNGSFANTPAPALGAHVIKSALERSKVPKDKITDVYFGNVLQGNVGQAPARQAVIGAGLPATCEAVTVNKVCASGLKAVALAAQNIQLGLSEAQVAGGMENMTLVPRYLPRNTPAFGNVSLDDGLIKDGLWDVYNQIHMGNCAENTAKKLSITREQQDEYALESYRRAKAAWEANAFDPEITPFTIKTKKGETIVARDEEYEAVNPAKVSSLRPAFQKDGTVTAANASTFSDGASAVVLGSKRILEEFKGDEAVTAKIISYADGATDPIDFPLAPTIAIPTALQRAGLKVEDIAVWEINEAFAAVSIAINKTLGLDATKVNKKGGAIALGHALGSSGSRILTSLLYQLKKGEYGCAAICNGGGGATAVIVQKV